MEPLCNSPIGKEKTVRWIIGSNSETETIRNIGITEGSCITVIGSFFGNVIIALDQFRYALDSDLAFRIKVS